MFMLWARTGISLTPLVQAFKAAAAVLTLLANPLRGAELTAALADVEGSQLGPLAASVAGGLLLVWVVFAACLIVGVILFFQLSFSKRRLCWLAGF
jgi:hypothetical protein